MNVLYINNEESPELDKLRERIELVRTYEACSVSLSREGGEKVLNEKPNARLEQRLQMILPSQLRFLNGN